MSVYTWSQTAADNDDADGTINCREGQAPSTINDSMRAIMAAIAKWRDDLSGNLTTAGTSTAYTVTTNQTFTALTDGLMFSARLHTTSGASPTLNVDSLGAKSIADVYGSAVDTGALISGAVHSFVYDSTDDKWIVFGNVQILPLTRGGTGAATASAARTNLGLVIGTDVQAYDAGLASIAGLTTAADRMIYTTASDTYAVATLTSFARTLLDDSSASAARSTLGVAIGSDVQAYDADLAAIAGLTRAKGSLIAGSSSAWAAQSVGTNGYVLMADSTQTNGIKWASMIPSGTDMLFYQAAAPTGWTGSNSFSNHAIRVVTTASASGGSSGGSTAFTSVFAARTITASNLPDHSITITDPGHTHSYTKPDADSAHPTGTGRQDPPSSSADTTGSSTTGITAAFGSTARGGAQTAMDFAVAYISTIVAAKD